MSEIKKGAIIRAWDDDKDSYILGFYCGPGCPEGHRVYGNSKHLFSTVWQNVEPLPLMPELPEGVKIGDVVELKDDDKDEWATGVLVAVCSDGRVVCDDDMFWDKCSPIRKTETRVADLEFIYRWLHQKGFFLLPKCGEYHTRFSNGCGLVYTLGELEEMAGKEISKVCQYKLPEDWIMEVPK